MFKRKKRCSVCGNSNSYIFSPNDDVCHQCKWNKIESSLFDDQNQDYFYNMGYKVGRGEHLPMINVPTPFKSQYEMGLKDGEGDLYSL